MGISVNIKVLAPGKWPVTIKANAAKVIAHYKGLLTFHQRSGDGSGKCDIVSTTSVMPVLLDKHQTLPPLPPAYCVMLSVARPWPNWRDGSCQFV